MENKNENDGLNEHVLRAVGASDPTVAEGVTGEEPKALADCPGSACGAQTARCRDDVFPWQHDWKEEYYGVRCSKCGLFYAHGCAPWDYVGMDDATYFHLTGD